jgi:hypothetical protein
MADIRRRRQETLSRPAGLPSPPVPGLYPTVGTFIRCSHRPQVMPTECLAFCNLTRSYSHQIVAVAVISVTRESLKQLFTLSVPWCFARVLGVATIQCPAEFQWPREPGMEGRI